MRPHQEVPPLLLLLLLGLARAATPVPDGSTPGLARSTSLSPTGLWNVSYKDVVSATVELLNTRAVTSHVLKLLEVQSPPGWSGDLRQRQELSFTVKETTCQAPGTATTACKSQWLGTVGWCHGHVFLEQHQPTVELSCEKAPVKLVRVRVSNLKHLLARIKLGLRGFFQCGKIWIRDQIHLKELPH